MNLVKVFGSGGTSDLEKIINVWLAEMGDKIEILERLQSSHGAVGWRETIVTIWYRMKSE